MTLVIDIGNTTTSFGLFRGRRLVRTFAVPTAGWRLGRGVARRLKSIRAAREAIVCSVVPWATPVVAKAVRSLGFRRVRIVGHDIKVPLKNRYRYPRQVGQDRLVGAYAAWRIYRTDCIVADFGTAITIDLVTRKGEYLGGAIAPGLDISLEALAARTALLPRVALREPPGVLGRDTANSIRSGLLYGFAGLCDGLVSHLKRRHAPKATVIGTGGSCPRIAPYTRTIDHLRPALVLEGLKYLSALAS